MKKAKRKPMPSVVREKETKLLKEQIEARIDYIASLIMIRLKDLLK